MNELIEKYKRILAGAKESLKENDCEFTRENIREYETILDALRRTQPANEPLTLDELRGMDGEPVWCEYINLQGARRDRKRCICHTIYGDIQPMDGYAEGGTDTSTICYGKTWLAYRRKPEKEK